LIMGSLSEWQGGDGAEPGVVEPRLRAVDS
jgi:hypothetical protein